MKIEHVALYVQDLTAAKDFFVSYFGAAASSEYHNAATGFRSYFLHFEGGARLELMTRPGLAKGEEAPARTGFIHLAFSLGSRKAVDRLTERLREDGYAVLSGPRVTGDGYYESCIAGVEGSQIELTV